MQLNWTTCDKVNEDIAGGKNNGEVKSEAEDDDLGKDEPEMKW